MELSKQYNSVKDMIDDLYDDVKNSDPKISKPARERIDLLWNAAIIKNFRWTGKIAINNWRRKGMEYWKELLKPEKVVFT